jgi:DnaJ domain
MIELHGAAEIDAVAKEAARLFGQEWRSLKPHSRDILRNAVKDAHNTTPQTKLEFAVRQALEKWQAMRRRSEIEAKRRETSLRALGLKDPVTATEIEHAYKRLIRRHHPDAGGSDEMAKKIIAAYQTLKEK